MAFVLLTVGVSMLKVEVGGVRCGFSLLLVCMMTGTVFCNVCPTSEELMDRLDRWVSPINILFFVLSGAELDLTILSNLWCCWWAWCTSPAAPWARSAVLCQLPCHQVQPQHPEVSGHHPAAPGWRSPGHGRRGCPAF